MKPKTCLLLMAGVVAVCVSVAYALDQQVYASMADMRADIREILKILMSMPRL